MCGLFLVVQKNVPIKSDKFSSSVDLLKHRGPDSQNQRVWSLDSKKERGRTFYLGAGHTRLSILDLDSRSNQPFIRGNKGLIYNGEIYNYRSLKEQQFKETHFQTEGDTEVIFESLHRFRGAKLNDLSGMWSFVFWNDDEHTLIASRDRYGKKPLFYYIDDQLLCLSSEIKPMINYLGTRAALRESHIETYLKHGYIFPDSEGSTHFAGIRQVKPGHYMDFSLEDWKQTETRYFNPFEIPASVPGEEELYETLKSAVCSRLISDRPVGLLLSGGIDSSLILSILAAEKLLDGVKCYYGNSDSSEDVAYAIGCIKAIGVAATEIKMDYGESARERFLRICRHQEKPFPWIGNVLSMARMYEAIHKDGVCVVLDGSGADEVFGGYRDRYLRFAVYEAVRKLNLRWLVSLFRKNRKDPIIGSIVKSALKEALPWSKTKSVESEDAVTEALSKYCTPHTLNAINSDPFENLENQKLATALLTDCFKGRMSELIWHTDRNAMMYSIENRSPFLDNRLVPFAHTSYAKKYRAEWNKLELRKVFSRFRELPTQWRYQKQGFGWHGGSFMKQNQKWIIETLADSSILKNIADMSRLVDDVMIGKEINIKHPLIKRMLCIAGIEQTIPLRLDTGGEVRRSQIDDIGLSDALGISIGAN